MWAQKWKRIVPEQCRFLSVRGYASWQGRGSQSRSGQFRNEERSEAGSRRSSNRFGNRAPGRSNYRTNNRSNNRSTDGYSSRSGGRDADEADVLSRTRGRMSKDDGLMGQPNYELNRNLDGMKWTELIPEGEVSGSATQGVSEVPTSALAQHRLLSLPLVNSLLHNRKYEWLTPVQAQTILPILRGESCVVRAKTGTGKTAAFSIPTIQKVLEAQQQGVAAGKVKALVISPTRELAQQIADEIFKITNFGGLANVKVQSLVGGLSKGAQMRAAGILPGSKDNLVADIIVATPGRLKDVLLEEGVAERFSELQFRVFDEADRILDIGFEGEINDIRDIIDGVSPSGYETPLLLFSATADRTVRRFAQSQFGDRVRVVDTVPKDEPTANELVDQVAVACPTWAEVYEGAVREILQSYTQAQEEGKHFKAIVFLPTTAMVDHFDKLVHSAFSHTSAIRRSVFAVHGQRTQASRQRRSDEFRRKDDAILITTDVVARGMDFPLVTHVFQLGVPPDVSSYVHRIGRTARIGNSGKSFLFYTPHVRAYVDALARENIRPATKLFEADPEFHSRFIRMFARSVPVDENAEDLVHSLMSYMTVLKSKYRVNSRDFLRDMVPFVELMGLQEVPMSQSMRQTWQDRPSKPRGGYGSSRRSRMRWN